MHLPAVFALLTLFSSSLAAKPAATSFCKCICFNNSTIIALNPPTTSTQSSRHRFDIRSPNGNPDVYAGTFDSYSDPRRDLWSEHEYDMAEKDKRSPDLKEKRADGDDAKKPSTGHSRPHHKLTCADCTRAFCLDYNLPICKNAREEDVFTTCFQRDSLKDESVVVIFIFATAGLLAWALVKPWIDRLRERSAPFIPLAQHHDTTDRQGVRPLHTDSNRRGLKPPRVRDNTDSGAPTRGPGIQVHADQDAVDIVSSGSGLR